MESQRELNRAMSQLSRILELSGNPIAVLENVEESEDIAVSPGAVWNIPEDAKAYLLNLHINCIDLIYRALHDLSESPRSAFGGIERDISGVTAVYDGDWNLLCTGRDSAGNYRLWSLVYGDGGEVAAGAWFELREFARAPSGGQFEYHRAFLDKPDVCRGCYIEKFPGSQAYCRPFWSHQVAGSAFGGNLWREPVPFDLSSEYGLAMAHHGDYCWLSCPNGVWRAPLARRRSWI
jgi:hypothetical protein